MTSSSVAQSLKFKKEIFRYAQNDKTNLVILSESEVSINLKWLARTKCVKFCVKFDFKGEIQPNFTKNLTKKQKSAKNSSFFAKKC